MEHHFVVYPPRYFFGNPKLKKQEYVYDWTDYVPLARFKSLGALCHDGPMYLLAFGVIYIAYKLGASRASMIGGVLELFIVGSIAIYLHNSFHVKDHWLERFQWFHELRALHYIHHLGNANHNYALMNFGIDKFLHLYHVQDPKKELQKDIEKIDHEESPLPQETIKHVKQFEKKASFHSKLVGFH